MRAGPALSWRVSHGHPRSRGEPIEVTDEACRGSAEAFQWDTREDCEVRQILDRIADKWSLLVIALLREETLRFSELRRAIDGISQRMLTVTLRNLERDGLVSRTVYAEVPPGSSTASRPSAGRCWRPSSRWSRGPRSTSRRSCLRGRGSRDVRETTLNDQALGGSTVRVVGNEPPIKEGPGAAAPGPRSGALFRSRCVQEQAS